MESNDNVAESKLRSLGYEPAFKRVLGVSSLVWFGLSYLSPIEVFTQFGLMSGMTHGMMTLAYLVATLAILFTVASYSKMVSVYPVAGSAYTYVQRSVNPHLGFITGWVMLLDYILLPMVCILFLGLFMNNYCPLVPIWAWIILSVLIVGVINVLGIEPTVRVNTGTVIAQAAFSLLFLFVVAKLVMEGGGAGTFYSWPAIYNAPEFNTDDFLMSVGVLTIAFLGFDAVTTLAEETHQPEKTVGRALLFVCLIAGSFFLLISYFCQIAWPSAWKEIVDPNTGFLEVSLHLQADYMQSLYFWIGNLASLTCVVSAQATIARILFGMGRDGALPKRFFAYVSPRYKTPVYNIALVSTISLSAVFFSDSVMNAVSLISFGALLGFIMVNIAVISHFYLRGKRRSPVDTIQYLLFPLTGAGLCLYFLLSLAYQAKVLGFAWLGLGILYTALSTDFFRKLPPDLTLE
ncbi:APC family permease [Azotosporobacter soli]|uniref:APC family permease n=1 Tax=Azotosporobacter soli TaxID=3055040 RepID=UPI0031FEFFC4